MLQFKSLNILIAAFGPFFFAVEHNVSYLPVLLIDSNEQRRTFNMRSLLYYPDLHHFPGQENEERLWPLVHSSSGLEILAVIYS